MEPSRLDAFHDMSRGVDYGQAMQALLSEFRQGEISKKGLADAGRGPDSPLGSIYEAWDRAFPRFPKRPWLQQSVSWLHYRGIRDAYLKQLTVSHISEQRNGSRLIVNPVAIFGRHARWLARALPDYEVIGSDIQTKWDRLYRLVSFWKYPGLKNYRFVHENIYEPDTSRRPVAVVFWGACGSLTDAAMDYAIAVNAPFLIFRACCHDNIGHNIRTAKRLSLLSLLFAAKSIVMSGHKRRKTGFYFSDRYGRSDYPRSSMAKELLDSSDMITAARNSVESDICRSLIDLDRCLYLKENGYDVLYREELFFAHRR